MKVTCQMCGGLKADPMFRWKPCRYCKGDGKVTVLISPTKACNVKYTYPKPKPPPQLTAFRL